LQSPAGHDGFIKTLEVEASKGRIYKSSVNNYETHGEESAPEILSPEFLFSSLESESPKKNSD
jgi:hypothetical protein